MNTELGKLYPAKKDLFDANTQSYVSALDSLHNFFSDLDLLITEGYKGEEKPKIEVVRAARHQQALLADDVNLIAVVTDVQMSIKVPVFGMEDIAQLADFIEKNYLL